MIPNMSVTPSAASMRAARTPPVSPLAMSPPATSSPAWCSLVRVPALLLSPPTVGPTPLPALVRGTGVGRRLVDGHNLGPDCAFMRAPPMPTTGAVAQPGRDLIVELIEGVLADAGLLGDVVSEVRSSI